MIPLEHMAEFAETTISIPAAMRSRQRRFSQIGATKIWQTARVTTLPQERQNAYCCAMTKLLDRAVEAVRGLPADTQDDIARAMLLLASKQSEPEPIDPAHLPDVLESLAQAKRREFTTDDQIEAAFRRFE